MSEKIRHELEGRAYIRPVNRGVHFVGCHDDRYIEDVMEELNRAATGLGDGYGHLRLVIEWTPED